MPVVLITLHAYRSWSEGNARGFVQHGRGLKPPQDRLAQWRESEAGQPPNRFHAVTHDLLHALAVEVAQAESVRLHAASVTPTHLHLLVSFEEPRCTCGWSRRVDTRGYDSGAADVNPPAFSKRYHPKRCPAWQKAHALAVRYKRVAGGRLSSLTRQPGRKWFARGEDVSPIHDRTHYQHHLDVYLPRHRSEGGDVRVYGDAGAGGAESEPTD